MSLIQLFTELRQRATAGEYLGEGVMLLEELEAVVAASADQPDQAMEILARIRRDYGFDYGGKSA